MAQSSCPTKADYKLYCLDDEGHIVTRHDIVGTDEATAVTHARELCGDYAIEIWEANRFLVRLAKDGSLNSRKVC